MKFMSVTCNIWDVDSKHQWLVDEVGVTVFKTIEHKGHIPGSYTAITTASIVFYVPDEEFEIMLKLKYPPGTFEERMA